jgi:hypothetical protein
MPYVYVHDGAERRIRRIFVNNSADRTMLRGWVNAEARDTYRYTIAEANVTKGSKSSGTTSVTTYRGYRSINSTGSISWVFGGAEDVFSGIYATQTTGATTYPRRTFLTTPTGNPYAISPTTVRVSCDGGANWTTMTYTVPDPGGGPVAYAYYVDGDPFNLYGISDGTVLDVRIHYDS